MFELPPGTLVNNRYLIQKTLANGGMSIVYQVFDQHLRIPVALKQIVRERQDDVATFQDEAYLLASLQHPSLPRVTNYFMDQHHEFLVMDFIQGHDLARESASRPQPFPVEQVMVWADQLLDTLEYLHGHGTIHRDIKPANLKVYKGRIYLLDFGLARGGRGSLAPTERNSPLSGVYGYTFSYAPVEQIAEESSTADPRSDLYSLAAALYYLLTLRPPTSSIIRASDMADRKPDPLQPPHILNPAVPLPISNVLMQAMAISMTTRPDSASVMRIMLQHALASSVAEHTLSSSSRARSSVHRRLSWLVVVGILLLLGLVLNQGGRGWMPLPMLPWEQASQDTVTSIRPTSNSTAQVVAEQAQQSTATAERIALLTATAHARATNTPTATTTPTNTIEPTSAPTETPIVTPSVPPPTATNPPPPTATLRPRPTATLRPQPTATLRPRPSVTPRPEPSATPRPPSTATVRPQPTATTAQPIAAAPANFDGTWQGAPSTGGLISITVADGKIRSIYFEYASDVGPSQEGDCALVAPCPGYSSQVTQLGIRITDAGTFESARIPIRFGDNVRYLSISGAFTPGGSASGQLREDRPDDGTPTCTHRSFFDWNVTR